MTPLPGERSTEKNGTLNARSGSRSGQILSLCYHGVSPSGPRTLVVAPSVFESQIRYFLAAGFEGATFTDAVTGHHAGKVLVVTFDDAYASVVETAYPILSRLGVPGTIFAPTGRWRDGTMRTWSDPELGDAGRWRHELSGASWSQLAKVADNGWELGSHTRTHASLPTLNDAELAEELAGSRTDCEREIGRPCTSIAYPYGDTDDRVIAAARTAGYSAGATVAGSLSSISTGPDPMRWPRIGVHRGDGALGLRAKASLYRYPRAWNNVRILRNLLRRS